MDPDSPVTDISGMGDRFNEGARRSTPTGIQP
jgi:hypothetical protein